MSYDTEAMSYKKIHYVLVFWQFAADTIVLLRSLGLEDFAHIVGIGSDSFKAKIQVYLAVLKAAYDSLLSDTAIFRLDQLANLHSDTPRDLAPLSVWRGLTNTDGNIPSIFRLAVSM